LTQTAIDRRLLTMFPNRYFSNRYYAARYYAKLGATIVLPPSGGKIDYTTVYVSGSAKTQSYIPKPSSTEVYTPGSAKTQIFS
jgi:hypothetical protein